MFMSYVGIKDHMAEFDNIILTFFHDLVDTFIEVNNIINAIEISLAATFLMGFLFWKYITVK